MFTSYMVITHGNKIREFKTESLAISYAKKNIKDQENFDTALIITNRASEDREYVSAVHTLMWLVGDAYILEELNI